MDLEIVSTLTAWRARDRAALLRKAGLDPDEPVEVTALLWDEEILAGTASRQGNILKCIALDERYQGQDATATLITALRRNALESGIRHLFLYTKPKHRQLFESLFFYPVTQTDTVLLMESEKDGVAKFLETMPPTAQGERIGAAVMNCNPFTRGHRYLIERAAESCDHLYVFVLSEEQGLFPAADRLELVRQGTADLPNVTVYSTGPYLISSATFPAYFLPDKSRKADIHCRLDVQIFAEYFAPRYGIRHRFVGTEPLSPVTEQYNEALKAELPKHGILVTEIPRMETEGQPVSASAVRALLGSGQEEALGRLVPDPTLTYLKKRNLI